ncbi:protease [Pseudomonas aeruginosa]|nr:protease [Pseudomonas aeruginosa]
MRAERETIATERTAEGRRQAAEIRSAAERDARVIQAEASVKAAEIEAQARVEAARIYGKAYAGSPQLYNLLRSLDTPRHHRQRRYPGWSCAPMPHRSACWSTGRRRSPPKRRPTGRRP